MIKLVSTLMLTLASLQSSVAFAPSPNTARSTAHELQPSPFDDQDTTHVATSRRHVLTTAVITIGTAFSSAANADVIGAGRCANGEGDGCDSLAGGNAYIQSLQKKSSENKEENQRVSLYLIICYK